VEALIGEPTSAVAWAWAWGWVWAPLPSVRRWRLRTTTAGLRVDIIPIRPATKSNSNARVRAFGKAVKDRQSTMACWCVSINGRRIFGRVISAGCSGKERTADVCVRVEQQTADCNNGRSGRATRVQTH
jgi:hypothetical protein